MKSEIRNKLFQLAALVFKLFQPTQLGNPQTRKLLLPVVGCLLADPKLSSDLGQCRTRFMLTQCKRNRFFRKMLPAHGVPLHLKTVRLPKI